MEKKGQQMTLSTIIVIVLGITVLVFLIYGFSTGWGELWERVTGIGGTDSNIDTILRSCDIACTTKSTYDYNTLKRTLELANGTTIPGITCSQLEGEGIAGVTINACTGI